MLGLHTWLSLLMGCAARCIPYLPSLLQRLLVGCSPVFKNRSRVRHAPLSNVEPQDSPASSHDCTLAGVPLPLWYLHPVCLPHRQKEASSETSTGLVTELSERTL